MEDTFSVVGEDLAEKGTFGQRPEVREGDAWGMGGSRGGKSESLKCWALHQYGGLGPDHCC